MNKIEKLLEEFCPQGVEFKMLGEVCEIRGGWGFPKVEQGKSHGEYPFIKVGDMNSRNNELRMNIANNYISNDTVALLGCNPAPAGTVIFPKIGAAIATNKKRILTKFSCYDNNVFGLISSDLILPYFLLYLFQNINLSNFANDSGAIPSIRKSTLEKYKIPIPPLTIQKEIVKILDNFTQLEAELEAELEARKKQYEYYRGQLLMVNDKLLMLDGTKVEFRALGKVANIKNGKDWKVLSSGDVPVYGTGGIMGYVDKFSYNQPTVLIPRKGSIENIFYLEEPFWNIDTIYYTEINIKIITPKYFYYFLETLDLKKLDTGSGRPSLTQTILNKIKIPIPPLAKQREIVTILDKFDALVNDISTGLPAEIVARKKQYQYYRNQLLNFKPLDAQDAN